jgi:hypothetical protein
MLSKIIQNEDNIINVKQKSVKRQFYINKINKKLEFLRNLDCKDKKY